MSHQDMLYFTLATAIPCLFAWAASKLWLRYQADGKRSSLVGAGAMGALAALGTIVIVIVFTPPMDDPELPVADISSLGH